MVNEVGTIDNPRLENQLTELTSLVRQLAISQHQPIAVVKACGICTLVEHPIGMCPTLQEIEPGHPKSVGSIGGYQYEKQPLNIQFKPKHALETRQLPTTESKIPGNSLSLEDMVKQLVASNLEFQQTMSSNNLQFQQNMSATIQDLKMQVGQLANSISQLQSAGFGNLPLQTIQNPRGNASVVSLRRELQEAPQQKPKSTGTESKQDADSQAQHWTLSTRKLESDEELLKMFWKVEINIPLLDAIKQIPKYAKFLKELCVHKRKKMKRGVELGGIVSALTRNDNLIAGTRQALPKKCQDPGIFLVPCTIGDYTFADAMLD
ncbi:hypothetical protein CR513_09828, partial [Mucuna pruriens]